MLCVSALNADFSPPESDPVIKNAHSSQVSGCAACLLCRLGLTSFRDLRAWRGQGDSKLESGFDSKTQPQSNGYISM